MPREPFEPLAPPPTFKRSGVLTSGDVAREAGVTARTVRNWCDRGLLRCDVLPLGHRRIPAVAWEIFRRGGTRTEQDAAVGPTAAEREELEWRLRRSTSFDEMRTLLGLT